MTEPDVTLTDYGLAIECAFFASLLYRQGDRRTPLRAWFALFFASMGAAALIGGTVHGYFLDTETMAYRVLWPATLIATGVTTMAAWAIGARLWFSEKVARYLTVVAVLESIAYSATVLFVTQAFFIVVANYLPAAVFLLIAFSVLYRRLRNPQLLAGVIGLVLTFAAAAVQQSEIALHPTYFNHNALSHVIQAAALFMIFWAARYLVQRKPI